MGKKNKHINASQKKDEQKQGRGKRLLEKKQYIELIISILSIPFFISVLILNFNSIKNLNSAKLTPTPSPSSNVQNGNAPYGAPIGTIRPHPTTALSATQAPCKKGLGAVSITSPGEGDVVTSNPVEVDISYDDSVYCSAAWSYRINGGQWSGYDDRSVALYNLPQGTITFELRVQSIASTDTTTLTRHFTYNGENSAVIPTSATASAH